MPRLVPIGQTADCAIVQVWLMSSSYAKSIDFCLFFFNLLLNLSRLLEYRTVTAPNVFRKTEVSFAIWRDTDTPRHSRSLFVFLLIVSWYFRLLNAFFFWIFLVRADGPIQVPLSNAHLCRSSVDSPPNSQREWVLRSLLGGQRHVLPADFWEHSSAVDDKSPRRRFFFISFPMILAWFRSNCDLCLLWRFVVRCRTACGWHDGGRIPQLLGSDGERICRLSDFVG